MSSKTPQEYDWIGGDVAPTVEKIFKNGHDVYFPGGFSYEFKSRVTISDKKEIRFFGDGIKSRLVSSPEFNQGLFRILRAKNIVFENLNFEGAGPKDPLGREDGSAIFAYTGQEIEIRKCKFTKFGGEILCLTSINGLKIYDNIFVDNEVKTWDSGRIANGDIIISSRTAYGPTTNVMIENNQCLSNNRNGIIIYALAGSAIIRGNIVTSKMDGEDREPSLQEEFRRKDGITLMYYSDNTANGPWDIICTSNIVRNASWSGIYLAGSTKSFNYETDGPFIVVANNIVSRCCIGIQPQNTAKLQAGISLRGLQMGSINGNVVYNIDPNEWAPSTHQAAGIRVYDPVFTTNKSKGIISIAGNSIRDIGGPGINIFSTKGIVDKHNNVIVNTKE